MRDVVGGADGERDSLVDGTPGTEQRQKGFTDAKSEKIQRGGLIDSILADVDEGSLFQRAGYARTQFYSCARVRALTDAQDSHCPALNSRINEVLGYFPRKLALPRA